MALGKLLVPGLIWIIVGQRPTVLAEDACGGCLDCFLSSAIALFFISLWEAALYRLKYCLKELLSPKQPTISRVSFLFFSLSLGDGPI